MSLKAVLLDIDGTLLDSNDAHARTWLDVLRSHGHEVTYETIRPLIGKGGDKLLMEAVGIDDESERGQQMSKERKTLFADDYLPSLQPTAGTRELLLRFLADGLQLVIATSAGADELPRLLRRAGIDDLVKTAASSTDAEASKPDPDIVRAALAKAGLRPDEAIMLGDTPHDVAAAKAAGVRTVALRCGGWWPDSAFEDAAAVYDDPGQLLQQLGSSPFAREPEDTRAGVPSDYERLHLQLRALHSAPVPDVAAIDAVMRELDATQAKFKASNRGADDHQRY